MLICNNLTKNSCFFRYLFSNLFKDYNIERTRIVYVSYLKKRKFFQLKTKTKFKRIKLKNKMQKSDQMINIGVINI